jgi:hypothetical protein
MASEEKKRKITLNSFCVEVFKPNSGRVDLCLISAASGGTKRTWKDGSGES